MGTVIGITGGSGCGKSLVSSFLAEQGALVIDADKIAREVVEPGQPALAELKEAFGSGILLPDGTLNRKRLGDIVFSNSEKLHILNCITHKYIKKEIENRAEHAGQALTVIDAPLLFETGLDRLCGATIAVLSAWEMRVRRIMERDALTREQAEKRIAAQPEDAFYRARADYVLSNLGAPEQVRLESLALLNKILRGANGV